MDKNYTKINFVRENLFYTQIRPLIERLLLGDNSLYSSYYEFMGKKSDHQVMGL